MSVFQPGVFQENVFQQTAPEGTIVFQCNVFQPNIFQVGAECLADYNPTTPTTPTRSGRGGGAGWDTGGRSAGRAKIRSPVTEDELRDTYDTIMGLKPAGKPAKAIRKALSPYLLAKALQPPSGLPEPDAIDWNAVLSDIAAQQAIMAAYERMMQDEDDAITLLLLAA